MKIFIKPLFIFVVLIFLSCSNNEFDKDASIDITGKWNSVSFIANEPLFDVNKDGLNSTNLLDELPCRYSTFILNSDKTFSQENNTWQFNQSTNFYTCTSGNDITKVNGTWKVNSNNTMLSLEINGNTAFLTIEFDGKTLKFNSSESFINKNASGELKNIYGSVLYRK